LPRGRSHLADQFTRASTSILLNLAEGAGKLSKPDKRRYYLTARARRRSRRHSSTAASGSSSSPKPRTGKARRCSCAWSRCSSSLPRPARSRSDPQPQHRAPDGDDGDVVAECLLVARGEATRVLEEVEGALDLGPRLVQLPVVRGPVCTAAVPRDHL